MNECSLEKARSEITEIMDLCDVDGANGEDVLSAALFSGVR